VPRFLEDVATTAIEVVQEQGADAFVELCGPSVRVQPANATACPVEIWIRPNDDQVLFALGNDEVPYEFVVSESVQRDDVWEEVLGRIRALLTAVVSGRYRQERLVTSSGRIVSVRGTFELPEGDVTHVARRSFALLRRKRRETVVFEPYAKQKGSDRKV
jgi:hypothetical protein